MMREFLRSPATSIALLVLAAALLLIGTIGAVQAAPRIQSQDYRAQVVLTDIETALTEYSASVTEENQVTGEETHMIVREGDDQLLDEEKSHFLADNGDDQIKIGKTYTYKLGVRNIAQVTDDQRKGNGIPQYVRVTVNKYWVLVDENGEPLKDNNGVVKQCNLNPAFIDLHFVEGDGWIIDKDASTPERTVLYYKGILDPGDDSSEFTDTLTIDSAVLTAVTKDAGKNKYDYKNVQFRIKATVDAVQTHNGTDAMTSAWGRTN